MSVGLPPALAGAPGMVDAPPFLGSAKTARPYPNHAAALLQSCCDFGVFYGDSKLPVMHPSFLGREIGQRISTFLYFSLL